MVLAILLINIKNRKGLRAEACRTPEVAGSELQILLSSSTTWLLFVTYSSLQVIIAKFKPNGAICPANLSCSTQSMH